MTPAPWKLSARGDGYHVTGETNGQWTKIATVHAMRPDDGRLIAAAPDLLEAAKRLRAVINDHVSLADVDALEAAIAKAEGRS